MPSPAAVPLVAFTAIYLFLRLILYLTQDAREPPTILTSVPFFEPMAGMFREKSNFHLRVRCVQFD